MNVTISTFITAFLMCLERAYGDEAGGRASQIYHLPHLAYLDISTPNGNTSCSGSVVHGEWVLTAAHCVLGSTGITAYAGMSHKASPDETKVQGRVAVKHIINPYFMGKWSIFGLNTVYDYCLLKLETSFYVDNITIKVVEMDNSLWGNNRGRKCTIAGFGESLKEERRGGDEKVYHKDIIVNQGVGACPCYRKSWLVGSSICFVIRKGRKPICPGDSGSPLVCDDRQVGLASHMYYGGRCDLFSLTKPSIPSCGMEGSVIVYQYVCPILNWMRKHVGRIIPKKPYYC